MHQHHHHRRVRMWVALAAASAIPLGVAVSAPSAVAATPDPSVLGGPGHAEMYPSGLEVAPNGDVVVADTGNDSVSRYAPDGTKLWTQPVAADGRPLENARDIAIGADGFIYVADDANYRIVKLAPDGTPVGNAWSGPSTDRIGSPIGISEKDGKVYVADASKRKVRVFDTSGTQLAAYGTTAACSFAALRDVDAGPDGTIYIANYTNNDIVRLTASGGCLGSWGTQGTADGQFKNPYGVRVAEDPQWGTSVYVADSNNNRFQVFSPTGQFRGKGGVSALDGSDGSFTTMRRVAVTATGDVWGADLWGWKVSRFARTDTGYSWAQDIEGAKPSLTPGALFNEPRQVVQNPDDTLTVVDTVNQRIVTMTPQGTPLSTCGARTNLPTSINWPRSVAIDPATGDRWVADTKQSRIQIWKADCRVVARIGTAGTGLSQFNWVYSVAIRASDRVAFMADMQNDRVVAWDVATRTPIASYAGSGSAALNSPRSISLTSRGDLLVSDSANNRVVRLSFNGTSFQDKGVVASGLHTPEGAAEGPDGRIWVSDTLADQVLIYRDGVLDETLTTAHGTPLNDPTTITTVGQRVYVSDTDNDRVLAYGDLPSTGFTLPPTGSSLVHGEGVADMYPVDVASTSSHHYVVDPGRYRVVAVNRASGQIDASFGNRQGTTQNELAAARAIAVDNTERVYVADTPNNRVQVYDSALRYLSSFGTKGTANGQLQSVYGVAAGPGLDAAGQPAEVVYTVDANRVQKWSTSGRWLATFGTGLNQPRQIDVSQTNGDVFVVNARARQVVVYGSDLVEKLRFGSAGSGPGQFNGDPRGVTVSADGTLAFVTDDGGRRVHVFSATSGAFLYTIGGGPAGTDATFTDPRGVQVTPDGTLVVTDEWDYSLKEYAVTSSGATFVRRLFGTPPPADGVNSPRGMSVDASGRMYVSDWWNQRAVRVEADGTGFLSWGQRGTRSDPGSFNFAWDLAVQPGTGRVFVANRESHEITVFTADGQFVTKWGSRGTGPGQLQFPQGLEFAPDGDLVVADSGNGRLERFAIAADGTGTFRTAYGSLGTALGQLRMPTGVDIAPDGTIWVADTLNNRVQALNPATGVWRSYAKPVSSTFTPGFIVPWGVTVAPDGAIWVADSGRQRLVRMSDTGQLSYVVTGESLGLGALKSPFDIEFSGTSAYVSDTWNNRVVRLTW